MDLWLIGGHLGHLILPLPFQQLGLGCGLVMYHTGFFRRALSAALNFLNFLKILFLNDSGTVCSFSCRLRSCFQIFHGAQFCSFCCCTSDVGRLAHQPCCHEPSCTLLGLQPISSMFGVRVCGSPPHLMMNGAYSSKCRPSCHRGPLSAFVKLQDVCFGGLHHCWKPRCRVHPFTRHVSCVL